MRRLIVISLLALSAVAAARRPPMTPFEPTLKAHLAAIAARDLPALLATVGEDVTLILPNGKRLDGKAAYRAFHEEWFAERGWTMSFKELGRTETQDLVLLLFETDYREGTTRAGSTLLMAFRRLGNRWQLVHDQNTRLPAP